MHPVPVRVRLIRVQRNQQNLNNQRQRRNDTGACILVQNNIFTIANFHTESGAIFEEFRLAYTVHGTLSTHIDSVVWIIHPFTATSDPTVWWPGLVGHGKVFDPTHYCVICVNTPGSPYGSSSPLDINQSTGEAYYHDFPTLTMRDVIHAFDTLREHLQISQIRILVGASMGGQLAYQWLVSYPHATKRAIIIAANPRVSAWMKASHHTQRNILYADPTWQQRDAHAGAIGMKLARQVAFLSYRSPIIFQLSQDATMRLSNVADEKGFVEPMNWKNEHADIISTYLEHQGNKFLERFNLFSYLVLLSMMDTHDIQYGYTSFENALSRITADVLHVGIDSDILFYTKEIQYYACKIHGTYREISSVYGHDAFLIEYKQLEDIIIDYLYQVDEHFIN